MGKIITPEESARILQKQSMTTEQKLESLDHRFEMLRGIMISTLTYIQSLSEKPNFRYDEQMKRIAEIIKRDGIKIDEKTNNFHLPKEIEEMNPHIVKMWLISNNIALLKSI